MYGIACMVNAVVKSVTVIVRVTQAVITGKNYFAMAGFGNAGSNVVLASGVQVVDGQLRLAYYFKFFQHTSQGQFIGAPPTSITLPPGSIITPIPGMPGAQLITPPGTIIDVPNTGLITVPSVTTVQNPILFTPAEVQQFTQSLATLGAVSQVVPTTVAGLYSVAVVTDVVVATQGVQLPNQGTVSSIVGAPPVDAGKQGKHVFGHNNHNPIKSQWAVGRNGVVETQLGWLYGKQLPDGTRVWDLGIVIGTDGQTGVRVHINSRGNIHGYPVHIYQYIPR